MDQLTDVTNTSDNSSVDHYTYDSAGNRTDLGLGDVNALNEYASLPYNDRGDVTDDGSFTFGWNAKDELISVMADGEAVTSKETFTYDAQGRVVAEDSWEMDGDGNWFVDAALSFRFIYDNQDRIVETAQGLNNVYTQFAWGPGGEFGGRDPPLRGHDHGLREHRRRQRQRDGDEEPDQRRGVPPRWIRGATC